MIIGIGTDIVQIKRIEKLYEKYGSVFKKRILSLPEIEKCDSLASYKHASFLAKRFAAKEAISKAFGTGISQGLAFKDITISNDLLGKPGVQIAPGNLQSLYGNNLQIDLSIADDYPVAIAFSVISLNANPK